MPAPSPGRKRVPRWRTMISPPVTTWPANTFTPRRLGFESRPLRLEPRPFLCAIGGRLLVGLLRARLALGLAADRRHPDAGELLAVAGAALVAALGLELEHAQLGAAQVAEHLGLDGHAVEVAAELGIAVAGDEQRLEIDRGALVGGQALDEQGRALLDAVLLAAGLDDCVGHDLAHSVTSEVSAPSGPAFARERRRPPRRPRRRGFESTAPFSPGSASLSAAGPVPASGSASCVSASTASAASAADGSPSWAVRRRERGLGATAAASASSRRRARVRAALRLRSVRARARARSSAASAASCASVPVSTARAVVRPASSIRTSFFSPTYAMPLTTSIR